MNGIYLHLSHTHSTNYSFVSPHHLSIRMSRMDWKIVTFVLIISDTCTCVAKVPVIYKILNVNVMLIKHHAMKIEEEITY
jgi:hypothetical protein